MVRAFLAVCNASFDAHARGERWRWFGLAVAARVLGRIVRLQLALAAAFLAFSKALSNEEDWP